MFGQEQLTGVKVIASLWHKLENFFNPKEEQSNERILALMQETIERLRSVRELELTLQAMKHKASCSNCSHLR
jgi:hypothetical protein